MAIKGKVIEPLTEETILNKLSEYEVYSYYIGHDFEIGKAFISPFRKENNPSFTVMVTKKGSLYHIDFADTTKKGNFVTLVMHLFAIPYDKALLKIDKDFNLGIVHRKSSNYKKRVIIPEYEDRYGAFIQVIIRKFNREELDYWSSYYITEDELKLNDVYAVKKLYVNRQLLSIPPTELVFGYLFEDRWKIYRPFAEKQFKWINNVPNSRMSGLFRIEDNCKNIVITKAKKDEIVLAKFLPHVCSAQAENTMSISPVNIKFLKERSEKIFLNFDSDEVGVQACKYYNQFGFLWVNCPLGYKKPDGAPIKDFADLAKYHGMQIVIDHFKRKGII